MIIDHLLDHLGRDGDVGCLMTTIFFLYHEKKRPFGATFYLWLNGQPLSALYYRVETESMNDLVMLSIKFIENLVEIWARQTLVLDGAV